MFPHRHLFRAKRPKLGKCRVKFDRNGNGAAREFDYEAPEKPGRKPAPLQGKDRFLWDEEDVKLAIEWFKKWIEKDAVTVDGKGHLVRLENVIELMERAFGEYTGGITSQSPT
jgi:hypothetical protein